MRTWTYTWKSSDGLRHEGEMGAPDKDSVYAALRERGIRAIKVTERIQPVVRKGFKGLRKRDVSCIVLGASCLVALAWFLSARITKHETRPPTPEARGTKHEARLSPLPRHQIKGFESIDLAAVFAHPSEAYLARYAQVGYVSAERGVASAEIIEDLIAHLKTPIAVEAGDAANVAELKRTVTGLKADVNLMLTSGRGINDILVWLDERQKMEAAHRERFVANVKRGVMKKESANQTLRTMGLKEIE